MNRLIAVVAALTLAACGGSETDTSAGTVAYTVDLEAACHTEGLCVRVPYYAGLGVPTPNALCFRFDAGKSWYRVNPTTLVTGHPCVPDGRCTVTSGATYPVVQMTCQAGVTP